MSNRVSRKQLETVAAMLAEDLGHKWGHVWTSKDGHNVAEVGNWDFDYNPIYGGYIIEEILNEAGGVCHPLYSSRMPAAEMLAALNMARAAVRHAKQAKIAA